MTTLKLANLFTTNAILQRERPVPIWGWSTPGETVTVKFARQKKTAVAGPDGKWLIYLDALPASTKSRELTVASGQQAPVTIQNVLVGDVWLCSGQSNMQMSVAGSNNAEKEIATAKHPRIRLFTVPNQALMEPQTDVNAAWQVCSPETIPQFSAVGYFFGRELLKKLTVPIGLINCSWGGTRVEAWTSRDALRTHAIARSEIDTFEKWRLTPAGRAAQEQQQVAVTDLEAWEHSQGKADPGNSGHGQGWAARDFDDSAWPEMQIPSAWQTHGHNFSGVFWYRRTVEVPADWAGHDLVLHLGAADKTDTTYFTKSRLARSDSRPEVPGTRRAFIGSPASSSNRAGT